MTAPPSPGAGGETALLTPQSRPVFKRSVYARALSDGRVLLAFHPREALYLRLSPQQERLLLLLDGQRTVAEITDQLNREGAACRQEEVLAGLNRLHRYCLLEDRAGPADPESFSRGGLARYERNLLFMAARQPRGAPAALAFQRRLAGCRVVLLGLGGGGCHLFAALAALGVGRLTLVDYDRVEASNLNRQTLYRPGDLGRPKMEVVREAAPRINPDIDYEFVERRISGQGDIEELIAGADLALLAADSPREKIFAWMDGASRQTGAPALFTLGVTPNWLHVGPLVVPGQTPCFLCAMPPAAIGPQSPLVERINRSYRHGVIISQVQILAGLMGWEALKFLTGLEPCRLLGHVLHLNFVDYQMRREAVQPREDCPVCAGLPRAS